MKKKGDSGVIYHRVRSDEGVDETVEKLLELIKEAQRKWPNKGRILMLDVDGHLDETGKHYNKEVLQLIEIIFVYFMPYLERAYLPIFREAVNKKEQNNDIPETIAIDYSQLVASWK